MMELLNHQSFRILLAAAACCLWLPAGAAAAQASRVTLSRAPSVSQDDYPERAIRLEAQGLVVVDSAVDPTGVATGCTPIEIESPGYGLEEATCRIWTRRARFSAARNASGVAIAGTYRAEMQWVIPEPEPEPPAPAIVPPNPVARDEIPVQTVQTAAQLLRGAMEQRGFYDGVRYEDSEEAVFSWDSGGALIISEAVALGGGAGTYLAVLRNTTNRAYCLRINGDFSPASALTGTMQGNVLVGPYQHTVLAAANSTYMTRRIGIAVWPPDMSRERACSDVAPPGLETWANGPLTEHFSGSRFR